MLEHRKLLPLPQPAEESERFDGVALARGIGPDQQRKGCQRQRLPPVTLEVVDQDARQHTASSVGAVASTLTRRLPVSNSCISAFFSWRRQSRRLFKTAISSSARESTLAIAFCSPTSGTTTLISEKFPYFKFHVSETRPCEWR